MKRGQNSTSWAILNFKTSSKKCFDVLFDDPVNLLPALKLKELKICFEGTASSDADSDINDSDRIS